MLKRKFISPIHQWEKNEDTDEFFSASDDETEIKSKRTKPDSFISYNASGNRNDKQYNQKLPLSDRKQSTQISSFNKFLVLPKLENSNEIIPFFPTDEEEKGKQSGVYDGFENFMKSFHFLSDDEDLNEEDHQESNSKNGCDDFERVSVNESCMDISYCSDQVHSSSYQSRKAIRFFPYQIKNLDILYLDYPASILLHGYVKVTLISGKALIQGYELKIGTPVTVFSKEQTGILSLSSQQPVEKDRIFRMHELFQNLGSYIPANEIKMIKGNMKKSFQNSTVVVVLEKLPLSSNLEFLQLYSPEAVSFKVINNKSINTELLQNDRHVLNFTQDYEEIFTKIEEHLYKINKGKSAGCDNMSASASESEISDSEDNVKKTATNESVQNLDETSTFKITGARILIYGPKKAGKSVMSRYLVNRFLNSYQEVYYLDTDPGQTEFTPPGTVSLTKVTKPLLGPPFTHQEKPIKMIFTGSVTPETSPPMHIRSIINLIEYFNKNFSSSVLLVNTCGWITGIGNIILQAIKKNLMPTVEIELHSEMVPLSLTRENRVLKCNVGFLRDTSASNYQGDFRPADLRDFTLLSYLGKCQQYFLQPTFLNAMRPVCVCWDDIAVYNFNKRLPYNRFYEALNCSIVALCSVEKSYLLISTNPDYPNTLEDEALNECLGFGLVRAVDEERHLLYVITPVELSLLRKVNTVISGNILVPRSVLLNQPIFETELDYTDESELGRTETRKSVKRRTRTNVSIYKKT